MANLLYNLAQPFSNTKQYTQGTIVVYNDRMYEMTASDYTPGAFNPEKFTERFLSEMISGKLNSNLINEISIITTDSTNKTYSIDTKANYVFVGTCALSAVNSNHKKIEIGENYTETFLYDSKSVTINYTWNDRKLTITRSSNYGITSVIIVY